MCFTLFGLTFSVVRAAATERGDTWYSAQQHAEIERLVEAARIKGQFLYELHR